MRGVPGRPSEHPLNDRIGVDTARFQGIGRWISAFAPELEAIPSRVKTVMVPGACSTRASMRRLALSASSVSVIEGVYGASAFTARALFTSLLLGPSPGGSCLHSWGAAIADARQR